jgi:hypothetical protein
MNKEQIDIFEKFRKLTLSFPNEILKSKMHSVCNEQLEYLADELLLLSEEILSQVSAYGVCLYLQHGGDLQTEKNNDYILHDLFLHEGHQNAGPIFYRVRDLVQELSAALTDKQIELFNSESEINKKLQELAAFRNALMHGFFKLPSERNFDLVKKNHVILEKLLNHYAIFNHEGAFHFWKNEGFSGHWNIQDNDDWNYLSGKNVTLFEKLASKAKNELNSADFVKSVDVSLEHTDGLEQKEEVEGFISSDFKESLYIQFHPRDKNRQDEFYKSAYAFLSQKQDIDLLSYTIDENGIGYTSYLLLHRLLKKLGLQTNENEPKKKIKSKVTEIKNNGKKLVILINNIHWVPFASDHFTLLMKFFKESGIYFMGIGWEYEHLNSIFSQKLDLRKEINTIPDATEIDLLIKNHTRHRGPYKNEKEYDDLKSLIDLICERLKDEKTVIARHLADEENLDIELINEALYILYPHFKYDQSGNDNTFIKDDLDELYGFPKTQTETSSIFLTLGRRDIDLEYKHKMLKP